MGRLTQAVFSRVLRLAGDGFQRQIQQDASLKATERFFREVGDIRSLRLLLESGRLRRATRPVQRDVPDAQRILVYAPHQDDEMIGAGGTLLGCAARGKQLKAIYVTDGAAGKPTQRADMAEIRKAEALKVWEMIGGERPEFWGLPCHKISLSRENAEVMRGQIEDFGAGCVFVPFFLEPPLDHRCVCQLLLMAHEIKPLPESLEIWSYQVSSMLCPNVVVDMTAHIDRKDAVNRLWESQNAWFNYAHYARGMAAYNSIYLGGRCGHRPEGSYAEIFFVARASEYSKIVGDHILEAEDKSAGDLEDL